MSMAMWSHERLYLAVLRGPPPTDAEWERWIAMSVERLGRDQRVIVESHNNGPNAAQRKAITDAMRNVDVRVAVMTDSGVVRGIVTALAWLGVQQRAFPLHAERQAAIYLGLTSEELEQSLVQLPRLRREVGLVD